VDRDKAGSTPCKNQRRGRPFDATTGEGVIPKEAMTIQQSLIAERMDACGMTNPGVGNSFGTGAGNASATPRLSF
jgi:hypothetical protein